MNASTKDTKIDALYSSFEKRIEQLRKLPKINNDTTIEQSMEEANIDRRDFMKWAGAITAMLSLPSTFTPLMAEAVEVVDRLPLIWLHGAECTGCSEALLRSSSPTIDSLIFDHISLEYHETLMTAVGWQAEENLENAMERYKGQYILMVEGGIPLANEGRFMTIGAHAKTIENIAKDASENAAVIFAIGTCSAFGGVQAAIPNPTGAVALSKVTDKTVINVPGCPPSEKNIVGSLMYYLLYGDIPALDIYHRPKWIYGKKVHALCERRKHFDAGEFVENFGDEAARKGYCLFKVGCKGPFTFNNCPTAKFNEGTSWPVQAGFGCIGCSEPDFWDTMGTVNEPLRDKPFHKVFTEPFKNIRKDKRGVRR